MDRDEKYLPYLKCYEKRKKPSKGRNTNPKIARPLVEIERRSKTIVLLIVNAACRRPQRHLPSSSTLLAAAVVAL
ncbi:uncharacterized protein G2W53_000860 [Senna tora]|uniref:Uncharacterized protein n=1 Tax=Senna tora TaxID=362788 RepID=A0A834XEH3_9FABA|nr:uncharacterized protein G2W53_000860 [Senna tora]